MASPPPTTSLWYKDAVIYQLHVKAFVDSNGDGDRRFPGLIERSTTSRSSASRRLAAAVLSVAAARRRLRHRGLPSVHPSYGTMANSASSCARRTAGHAGHHRAGDQPHLRPAPLVPARAPRRAGRPTATSTSGATRPANTPRRASSSSTPRSRTGRGTRPPQSYYWHRFFSHQPDLNFDNPRVFDAVVRRDAVLARSGVDGMRLDAVPYSIEREGTNNENLPETHDVLKRLRAALDARYPDRMLLAEANQWPEDVASISARATSAIWRSTSR